jgi:hypothetical protein
MDAGTMGGVIGGLLGIMGGAFGTYFSVKNTLGPRERAFMVRAAIVTWIAITAFLALLFILPSPYRWLIWIPYVIVLPIAIVKLNRKQQEIRLSEHQTRDAQ